jgi:hypothetical protein
MINARVETVAEKPAYRQAFKARRCLIIADGLYDATRTSSVALVGDWFSSEAVSSGGTRVLREALFTRDAPTVRQQIEDFDSRMQDLLAIRGRDETSARVQTTSYLASYLALR